MSKMTADSSVEPIVAFLRVIDGIVEVRSLGPNEKKLLLSMERQYSASSLLPLRNLGIEEVVGADAAVAILKTAAFRPPPVPTVFLVEETEKAEPEGDPAVLRIGRSRYLVIGREIIGDAAQVEENEGEPPPGQATLRISENFIMFPERRRDSNKPAVFLLPPVPFPELEEKRREFGIRDIVSASPSSPTDDLLRGMCRFSTNRSLGTIVIGFRWA